MQIDEGVCDRVYLACLCSLVVLILALPVFPSGDGSVHLYYSHVVGKLLSAPGSYGHEYQLRRIAGPYSLQYIFQGSMERVVGANMAEKLFVVTILLNLGLGFRFLARQLGGNSSIASMWALSLLPTWTLATGFMNYSLAIGFAVWALGCWQSLKNGTSVAKAAWFSVLAIALVFSHPLPLLLLICMISMDLISIVVNRLLNNKAFPEQIILLMVNYLVSCVAFGVPISISDKSRVAGEAKNLGFHFGVLIHFLQANTVTIIGKDHSSLTIYHNLFRILLGTLLFITVARLLGYWRSAEFFETNNLAISAVLLIAVTLCLPISLNGGYYVPERMWGLLWLILLAATAKWKVSEKWRSLLSMASILFFLFTLGEAAVALYRSSRTVQSIDAVVLPSDALGIYLAADSTNQYPNGLSWGVYGWSGARAFEHSEAILLNSPWLDITISPLQAESQSDIARFYKRFIGMPDDPNALLHKMLQDEKYKNEVFSLADFVFYVDPGGDPQNTVRLTKILFKDADNHWSCQAKSSGSLCVKDIKAKDYPSNRHSWSQELAGPA